MIPAGRPVAGLATNISDAHSRTPRSAVELRSQHLPSTPADLQHSELVAYKRRTSMHSPSGLSVGSAVSGPTNVNTAPSEPPRIHRPTAGANQRYRQRHGRQQRRGPCTRSHREQPQLESRDDRCSNWRRDPEQQQKGGTGFNEMRRRMTRHDGDRYHGAQQKESGGGRTSNDAGKRTRHKHVAKVSRARRRGKPERVLQMALLRGQTRSARRGSVRNRTNRLPLAHERCKDGVSSGRARRALGLKRST